MTRLFALPQASLRLLLFIGPLTVVSLAVAYFVGRMLPTPIHSIMAAACAALVNALLGVVFQNYATMHSAPATPVTIAGAVAGKGLWSAIGRFFHASLRPLLLLIACVLAAHLGIFLAGPHRPMSSTIAYLERLKAEGHEELAEIGTAQTKHSGRWLMLSPAHAGQRHTLRWIDDNGQIAFEYPTRIGKMPTDMGQQLDDVDHAVLEDAVAGEILKSNEGVEVAALWTHPTHSVSCLQLLSIEGKILNSPLWSYGRLKSIVHLKQDNLLVVCGVSPTLASYVPAMADWERKMKLSSKAVPRNPDIMFALPPDEAFGLLPPLQARDIPTARVTWMQGRVCNPDRELDALGWQIGIDRLERASSKATHHRFDAVVRVSRNESPTRSALVGEYRIPFDSQGRTLTDLSDYSEWRHRSPGEPQVTLLSVETEALKAAASAIQTFSRLTGNSDRMKQLIADSQIFAGDELDHVFGMIDLAWSSPCTLNNLAWSTVIGRNPSPRVCQEFATSIKSLLSTVDVPVQMEKTMLNTIGELLVLARDLSGAREALSQSVCRSGNPVTSLARLVLICNEVQDFDAASEYLDEMTRIVNKGAVKNDRFSRELVEKAEVVGIELERRRMAAQRVTQPKSG